MIYILIGITTYFFLDCLVTFIFITGALRLPIVKILLLFMLKPFLLVSGCVWTVLLYYKFFMKDKKTINKTGLFFVSFLIIFVLGVFRHPAVPELNKYGLLGFTPGSVQTIDFSRDKRKDNYPVCTFRYNSLGYRDIEPQATSSRKHTILMLGDSYIWGDGIPANNETIAALLRNELNKVSPGKYAVVSAAFPGLGIYGYFEFLKKLKPHIRPQLVMIGYLGDSDFDPCDFQVLVGHLPANAFLRNMVLNLHVIQRIHEVSQMYSRFLWWSKESASHVKKLFQKIADYSKKEKIHIVLVQYLDGRIRVDIPQEIKVFNLPERFQYKGKSSKLWYAKDAHPKPMLNKLLAVILSQRIVKYFQEGKADIFNSENAIKKENSSPESKKEGAVNVKATLTKKGDMTYQILFAFDAPMKTFSSFLCSCKVIRSFWPNPYNLKVVVKTSEEVSALPLTINPEGYNPSFTTEDDKQIPSRVILAKPDKIH